MNYIKQLNEFYPTLDYKPLNAEAIAIYFCLLQIANKTGWIDQFRVANAVLMSKCNIDKQKLTRAREKLISQGYIKYIKGKNQLEAPIYSIVQLYVDTPLDTPNNTLLNTADDTQNDTAGNTADDTINKQNKKKKIKENNIKEKNDVIEIYNSICTNLSKVQKLTKKREKSINEFLKVFSLEEFKSICELANNNSFLIGQNDRNWKADFDFLINPNKATNILEGKYSNNTKTDYKIEGGLQLLW